MKNYENMKSSNKKRESKDKVKSTNSNKIIFGIRTKLIGCFCIPVILIIILGIVSFVKSSKESIQTYEKSIVTSLSVASSYFEALMNDIEAKSAQIALKNSISRYFGGYYQYDTGEEMSVRRAENSDILAIKTVDKFISNIFVIADYGEAILTTGRFSTDNYFEELQGSMEIQLYKNSNKTRYYLSNHKELDKMLQLDEGEYSFSVIHKLQNLAFYDIGYVIVDVKMESVTSILDKLNMDEEALYGITIRDEKEIVEGNVPIGFQFTSQDFYKDAMEEADSETEKEVDYKYVFYNGEEYLYAYIGLGDSGMMLNTLIPTSSITKQTESLKNLTLYFVIIAAVIAILIGTVVASGISRVIYLINRELAKAADGDLEVLVHTKRKDEFGVLTKAITNMIISFKLTIHKILNIGTDVSTATEKVTNNGVVLLRASEKITMAVLDINNCMAKQAEDAQNCLNQMEQLSNQITSVSGSTNEIGEFASITIKTVSQGIVIVDELNIKSKDTRNITQSIIESIEHLESETKNVESIIATINDISEQTNLLSLNASIEAARAGSAGRGFSVVAAEIGKLANQSSIAADQIGEIIKVILDRTKKTVSTAKKAEEIVNSQGIALGNTVNVFSDINSHVEGLTKRLVSITGDLKNITSAKEDTLNAIESIAAIAEQTFSAANMLEITAEQQKTAVEQLNDTSNVLGNNVNALEDAVGLFKINHSEYRV